MERRDWPAARAPKAIPEAVQIQLLGGFRVMVGSRVIADTAWQRRKAKTLIKLLALAQRHRLHRDQILEILWPDLDPQAAANNLYQSIHAARGALDPTRQQGVAHYLQLEHEVLSLCPQVPLWVDVEAFQAAADLARRTQDVAAYRAAIDLYGGECLPEDRYEDWVSPRREVLHQDYLALLLALATLHEAQTEHEAAIGTLHQALAADPTSEAAHSGLMRLYAVSGRRQLALQQYHVLRDTLRRELDAEPAVESYQLYQEILADRLPPADSVAAAPPHMSASPAPPSTDLPADLTSFIGRKREVREVIQLLSTTRLLTLTGPGGSGKSRLALEVARRMGDTYPDGVWLVTLGGLSDPALVPEALATTLDVVEVPGRSLIETVVDVLRTRRLLILLDNCEHLIDACAQLVERLLRACPELHVLATSREPLHVAGEVAWPVPSLAVPNPRHLPPMDDLARCDAIQLFVERARAVLPAYALSQEDAAAVTEVCYRLDGIPLAIELAAARLRVLSASQIASRLDDRFQLLVDGARTALTRQQTLKATLDWSYQLLSEQEQQFFQRLGVFPAGFSLEAAEAIGGGNGIDPADGLDLLTRLLDKSLVTLEAELPGRERRYRLLETMRQYALAQLAGSDERDAVRRRHADYYLTLAEAAAPHLHGPQQGHWMQQLETEHDNLRAAMSWALDGGETVVSLRLGAALRWFWVFYGYASEGRRLLARALAHDTVGVPARYQAKALLAAGQLAWYHGDYETARPLFEESVAIWRALDDRQWLADALDFLSRARLSQGDHQESVTLQKESLTLRREFGDEQGMAFSLIGLGHQAFRRRDYPAAQESFEQALVRLRSVGDHSGIAQALSELGDVLRCQGDYDGAASYYEESLALFQTLGYHRIAASLLHNLGYVALHHRNYHEALQLFSEALSLFQEQGDQRGIAECLAGLAGVQGRAGKPERGARLFGVAQALLDAIGATLWPSNLHDFEAHLAAVRAQLGDARFTDAWMDGYAMPLADAITWATSPQPS